MFYYLHLVTTNTQFFYMVYNWWNYI